MKYLNQVRKYAPRLLGGAVMVLPAAAFAGGGGTYDAITSAVDFSDALTAVGVVAAALALFLVGRKGFRLVMSMIK